jgi:hypothetical protein
MRPALRQRHRPCGRSSCRSWRRAWRSRRVRPRPDARKRPHQGPPLIQSCTQSRTRADTPCPAPRMPPGSSRSCWSPESPPSRSTATRCRCSRSSLDGSCHTRLPRTPRRRQPGKPDDERVTCASSPRRLGPPSIMRARRPTTRLPFVRPCSPEVSVEDRSLAGGGSCRE